MNLEPIELDLRSDMIPDSLRVHTLCEHFERRDGVIVQVVTSRRKQELADAQYSAEVFAELARGQKRLLLVDMRVPFSTGPGVREFYASQEANRFVKGMALLIASDTGRMIGNFFLKLNRPPSPCRMFTRPRSALEWLHSL
ncbi:MAG: hypothetical protein ABW133_17220 [Polyangiaceae bacterium]